MFCPRLVKGTLSGNNFKLLELQREKFMAVFDKRFRRILGAAGLEVAAGITNPRRNIAASRLRGNGYAGPTIVAEGDSWFCYPTIVRNAPQDIIMQLGRRYAVYTEAKPGDLAQSMREIMRTEAGLLAKLEHRRPDILMLSAGGNDLFGKGRLDEHLLPGDRTISDYLKTAAYAHTFWTVIDSIEDIVRTTIGQHPNLKVILHGYDIAIPTGEGPWLRAPMIRLGIPEANWPKITKRIADQFNIAMGQLTRRLNMDFGREAVHFVDLRGTLRRCHWRDELHPKTSGFELISERFARTIDTIHP